MATIQERKRKDGQITGYKFTLCVGRDDQYRQIWRTKSIKRPAGLTPAKERKEVQRLCDEWEREQKAAFEAGQQSQDKGRITLADFVNKHWLPFHVRNGSHTPDSVAFYESMARDILSYFGEKKRLADINSESVVAYTTYLRTKAKTKRGEPLSAATVQHHFSSLRNVLAFAARHKYIEQNPCSALLPSEKPQRTKKRVDFLTSNQAVKFLQCLETEPLFWRAFETLLITSGLRRGEALGLQWGDINEVKLSLSIQRNVTIDKTAEKKIRVGQTKGKEARTVPLSRRAYALLQELRREQERKYGLLMPTAFVFCRTNDPYLPLYPTEPTRWQRKFVKRHGLPDVSPHDLRHTAASLALEGGADLKQIQQLLGHSDPGTTMRFYLGLAEEAQRRTVDGIDKLLAEGGGKP